MRGWDSVSPTGDWGGGEGDLCCAPCPGAASAVRPCGVIALQQLQLERSSHTCLAPRGLTAEAVARGVPAVVFLLSQWWFCPACVVLKVIIQRQGLLPEWVH